MRATMAEGVRGLAARHPLNLEVIPTDIAGPASINEYPVGVLAHIPHPIPTTRLETGVEPSPARPEAGTGHGCGVVELEE